MIKRKRNKEATMELIKKTSIDIFSKNGFDNATTKTIALKCRVAESLILKHFKSKQGLLNSITEDFIETITCAKQNLDYEPQDNLVLELQHYAVNTFEFFLNYNKVVRIVISKMITDMKYSKMVKKYISPPETVNLLLKERLEVFKQENKAPRALDAVTIDQAITFHILGFYLIASPLFNYNTNDLRRILKLWANDYAKGLCIES